MHDYFFNELFLGHKSVEKETKAQKSISYNDVVQFKDNFMKNIACRWFVGGHISKEDAISLCQNAT
jgi:secreted Zn-dependent insulinase-like peptidase